MAAHGGDYQFIKAWCGAQAEHSWTGHGGTPTCRRKVVQLCARGLSWDPANPSPGVWYGEGPGRRGKERAAAYKSAVDFYKDKRNAGQLDKDLETVAQYKAAVQLLLENADFDGNDRAARATKLFRTESDSVVKGMAVGEKKDFAVGPSESFSVFKTVCVNGGNGTIVNVPWSRVNAIYFMERTPGANDALFLSDRENEANVDAIGLEKVFAGKVGYGELVKKYHHLL